MSSPISQVGQAFQTSATRPNQSLICWVQHIKELEVIYVPAVSNKHVTVPGPAHGGRDGGCMGWLGLHACAATELKQIRLVNRINELYGQLSAALASIHGGCGTFYILRPGLNWCQAVGLILSTKMLASSCAALKSNEGTQLAEADKRQQQGVQATPLS
jgi:hypothetical protein